MTQDEIIEMAREAGFKMENSAAIQAAEIFAKLVAAKALAQRTWVGLTDVEIDYLLGSTAGENEETHISFARAIESKLKEVNT